MDQILQRGHSAPVTHNRSFSSALSQTQNNPLVRKVEASLTSGLHVTSARLVSPPLFRTFLMTHWFKHSINKNIRIFFFFHCRIIVQILKCMRLGHHPGLARRYFKATVMWQLQVILGLNWVATPRPMGPSTRVIWTICFETDLITSNCCHVTGYMSARCVCAHNTVCLEWMLGARQTKRQIVNKKINC